MLVRSHLHSKFLVCSSELPSYFFTELMPEMEAKISGWLHPQPAGQILVEKFRLQITRKDIATLAGLEWLNDEVCMSGLNNSLNIEKIRSGQMKFGLPTGECWIVLECILVN